MKDPETIAAKLLEGDRLALSRLISWAEDGDERFRRSLALVYARVGRSARTGITGPPGAGKSTLVNELARAQRERGSTVGILAVDPSSPFTGGALLGDRIRMEERTKDPGVYIRSMASREGHGGIARATTDALDVMDAFGFDELLIETVGVGQAEYEVVSAADTVVVVLCPGAGDGIQAMKAGILEVADVLVVNKSDREGAERLGLDLEEAVHTRQVRREGWEVPVLLASAAKGLGIAEVLDAILRHREHLGVPGLARARRTKRVQQVKRLVAERLEAELWSRRGYEGRAEDALARAAAPYDVAEEILASILGSDPTTRSGDPKNEALRR